MHVYVLSLNLFAATNLHLFLFQVAGLVSCALLLVVLLAVGPYFKTLPNASTNVYLATYR